MKRKQKRKHSRKTRFASRRRGITKRVKQKRLKKLESRQKKIQKHIKAVRKLHIISK